MTKFGEISPLWHNLLSLGQNVEGLFSIWQNFDPTVFKNVLLLGNFSFLQMAKYIKII